MQIELFHGERLIRIIILIRPLIEQSDLMRLPQRNMLTKAHQLLRHNFMYVMICEARPYPEGNEAT